MSVERQPPVIRFDDEVVAVIRSLADGEVVSYGDVAAVAGFPKRARAVGRLLSRGLDDVPWWRVVRADGRLAAFKQSDQAARLRSEGVTVRSGRVIDAPLGRFARRGGR